MNLKTLCTLALACSVTTLSAQKKPLDQSAYDGWKSVASPRISDKGDWICYSITPQRGDALLEFYNTTTGKITRVDLRPKLPRSKRTRCPKIPLR